MWLFTEHGFFSLVKKGNVWHLRARARGDLEAVRPLIGNVAIRQSYPGSDYPWRCILNARQKAPFLKGISDVEYSNFKAHVGAHGATPYRLHLYHEVWNTMRGLELADH
jgi:hypothetical protein